MTESLTDRALLERLIGFDTTSAKSNRGLADFLANYVSGPAITVEHHVSPDGTKANLVATVGPAGDDREGLVLSGHMDVVPAMEPEWESDPFRAVVHDKRVFGRGSCDMKGFLAVAANTFRDASSGNLRAPLALVFTYDEELGALGARHFVESWREPERIPRRVIIGEPTALRPVRAHKGHVKLRITVEGIGAHSALPHLGRNAIEPAARVVVALTDLREALAHEREPASDLFPDVPFNALNIARIQGGSAINIVPASCAIDVGIRLIPGSDSANLVERVHQAAVSALGPDGFQLEELGETPAMLLDSGVDVLEDVSVVAGKPAAHGVDYGTDAGWLQQMPCDCVVFGPGTMDVAHRPNEYLPLDQLEAARDAVDDLVRRWGHWEGP